MGWFLLVIAILLFIAFMPSEQKTLSSTSTTITVNEVVYPSDVVCDKCKKRVMASINTIDTSTWDLICECGHIAYKHPKRQDRIDQLDYLLDQTS